MCAVGDGCAATPAGARVLGALEGMPLDDDLPGRLAANITLVVAGARRERGHAAPARTLLRARARGAVGMSPGPLRLLIAFGSGRMGRLIASLAADHGCAVVATLDRAHNPEASGITPELCRGIDVAMEFTRPESAAANLAALGTLPGAHCDRHHGMGRRRGRVATCRRRPRSASCGSGELLGGPRARRGQ